MGLGMAGKLQVTRPDATRFDTFIRSSTHGCILQTSVWARFKSTYGWIPHRLAIERDGRILAGASVLEHDDDGRTFFYCPRGPVLDWDGDERSDVLSALMSAIRQLAAHRNARILRVDPEVDSTEAADLLSAHGFWPVDGGSFGGTQPQIVWRIPLSADESEIWAGLSSSARRQIRRARRLGVSVASGSGCLSDFGSLLAHTERHKSIRLRDPAYFQRLWELLDPFGLADIRVAYLDKKPLAGALVTPFGWTVWDLYAGTDRSIDAGAGYLVTYELLSDYARQGFELYDLGGVEPEPGGGLEQFKRRFGGNRIAFIGEYRCGLN